MRQGLEVGQGRLASLLKANQEDRETCRSLQESYAQCQAEIERLRKETGAQQLQLRQAPAAAVTHRGPKEEEPEAAKRHRPGHGGRGTAWTRPASGSCGPSGAAAAARPALELPLPAWAPSLQAPEEEAARSGGGEGGGEEKEGGGGGTRCTLRWPPAGPGGPALESVAPLEESVQLMRCLGAGREEGRGLGLLLVPSPGWALGGPLHTTRGPLFPRPGRLQSPSQ
ncbi:uncharacterized protein LOC130456200 [Monodelphis domestica]|uniref:uncharacterized protein LOC130456200 n=1 Tax=Monodelphis domestica TaxID=13616 RepID=UPI0024E27351|nr:uncharacterized protein LOC130456200 [Monodelphis domestica]